MAPRPVTVRRTACDAKCASAAVQVFSSEPAKITDEDIDAIISKGESETVRLRYPSRSLSSAPACMASPFVPSQGENFFLPAEPRRSQ